MKRCITDEEQAIVEAAVRLKGSSYGDYLNRRALDAAVSEYKKAKQAKAKALDARKNPYYVECMDVSRDDRDAVMRGNEIISSEETRESAWHIANLLNRGYSQAYEDLTKEEGK